MQVEMPEWTLEYQIGRDTLEDFFREQQIFRSDPRCGSYQSTHSADYPGRISVQVYFREQVGADSLQILQRRLAQAVRANPVRVEEYQDPAVFSRADLEAAQVRIDRRPLSLPILDREVSRARQQQMADEDARVFAALDSIVKDPKPPPPFKSRYQRILATIKERELLGSNR